MLKGEDCVGKASSPLCFGGPSCTPLVGDIAAFNVGLAERTILLASRFLEKVNTVFDWDDRTVSYES